MSIATAIVAGLSSMVVLVAGLDIGIAYLLRIPKESAGGHE